MRELPVLDGYRRWLDAVLAVVAAPNDVPNLARWPSVLPMARSLPAVRHWCRAVGLPAGASLDLARGTRAFVLSKRSGRPARKFLEAATRETANRFWRRAGEDEEGRLPTTLGEWLERQAFVRDLDALAALEEELRARFPDLL
jgi:hypothetical protein